jgi:anti-sigma factor RsiW
MSKRRRITDQDREDLIAFLDGELTGEEARAVERRLSLDPAARAEMATLKATWDLLDYLPERAASTGFTQDTMTKVSAIRHQVPMSAWKRPAVRLPLYGMGWLAALLLSMGIGFQGFRWLSSSKPSEEEQLARELRLIENKQYYEVIEDVEFLKDLDKPELFEDSPAP